MRKCEDCPDVVGDTDLRDCTFPDCLGGWERVYLEERKRVIALEAEVERLKNVG